MHILLAAALETLISLLSFKISWKGIQNRGPGKPHLPVRTDGDGYDPSIISRPDIIENHNSNYTNVIRELYKLQKSSIFAQVVFKPNFQLSSPSPIFPNYIFLVIQMDTSGEFFRKKEFKRRIRKIKSFSNVFFKFKKVYRLLLNSFFSEELST